ncbi:MAG: glycosyltransferase family 4 protein [Acidobacteria bacterium]|nr:glycosyltransferase family 4 protein [Acidobacteriota bacterium]
MFDGAWYLKQYEDVADAGINPLVHYVRRGAREGRNPNPLFNGNWYLQQNPEIAAAGENPLAHYIRNGTDEGRNPSAYFDLDWYLARNKDVKASGMHPLRHFLKIGTIQGRRPSPHISAFRRWAEGGRNENLPKLLMIDRIYPRPDQDSGSIDCINYIGLFQEFGYRVFFAADEEYNSEPEVYRALEERDVLCLNPADFLTIESFIESEIDDFSVVFLSRVYSGGRFYELIRKKNPGIKIIFNTVDLHAIREMREAKIKEDSKILKRALKTIDRERHLAGRCDATIIVSEFERKYLAEEIPDDKIVHIPLMRDCPGRGKEFSDRGDICFIGNYSHNPNTDALKYFLDEMWPLIHARLPLCRFFIIGPNLPEDIKRRGDPNVEELGHVTDLKSTLDRMRLSVAPLRYGAGVKGKVVTSLACGLPCVATDVAIEGMGLVKDQHIAVENSPPAFADCVVRLYGDRNIWEKYSTEGWRFCTQNNSLKAGRQRMAGLLESLNLPVHNS